VYIRLVSVCFGVREPKNGDEFRQYIQLLDQVIIELSPALVGGKHFAAFRRRPEAVPADDDGRGPLVGIEAQQQVREAKDGARGLAIAAANGFRQCVVRAMREGVAVNHQQRTI
jgi:hypothetical protein